MPITSTASSDPALKNRIRSSAISIATELVCRYWSMIFIVDFDSIFDIFLFLLLFFILFWWHRNDSLDIFDMSVVVTPVIIYYYSIYVVYDDICMLDAILSINYTYTRSILLLFFIAFECILTTWLCYYYGDYYRMGCYIVIFTIWIWGKYIITQFFVQGLLLNGLWNSFMYIAVSTAALHCWVVILHNMPIMNYTVKL